MSAFGCSDANTVFTVLEDPVNTAGADEEITRSAPTIPFGTLGVTPTRQSNPEVTMGGSNHGAEGGSSESESSSESSSGSKSSTNPFTTTYVISLAMHC